MTTRKIRGRIGGHTTHSRHDSTMITRPAREAFLARFEREVDPEGKLSPAERQKRAKQALGAYMARLALKRRKKRG